MLCVFLKNLQNYEKTSFPLVLQLPLLRKNNYPSIQKNLWGDQLWSPSYFASSCGGAPIEILRKYIEEQNTPE